jgi:hypothetical protein
LRTASFVSSLQFFFRELTVSILVKLLNEFCLTFFFALSNFRMILEPIFAHGLLLIVGKLTVVVLVVLLQNFGTLSFVFLLKIFVDRLDFVFGKLAILISIIFFKDELFTKDEHAKLFRIHARSLLRTALLRTCLRTTRTLLETIAMARTTRTAVTFRTSLSRSRLISWGLRCRSCILRECTWH